MSSRQVSSHYDWLVVGAGLIGLCTALHLARRKLRVCVIEQMSQVTNASTASGAGIRFFDPDPVVSAQVVESHGFYSELGLAGDFRPCPSYYCFGAAAEVLLDGASPRGLQVLSRAQLQARRPHIEWGAVDYAVEDEHAGFRDPLLTWHALRSACERLGVTFRFGHPVLALEQSAGARHLLTQAGRYVAHGVIFATGYWTPSLLERLGLPAVVRNRTITVHRLAGHNLSHLPFVVEHDSGFHARPTACGEILFGVPQPDWDVAPNHLPDRADAHLNKALAHLQRFAPLPLSFSEVRTTRSADAFASLPPEAQTALPAHTHVLAFGEGAAFKYAPAKTLAYINSILGS
ncbi:UNVERIFIED_ORG: glycine/D-amino acid oxidase-like deaminating enzyme [Pseudomonas fluorescens]|jgi:glycine/D-amino acid oxidase-like deaminating enzyme|uniref:NAD(P)/FAD-dependent oxidoreductase n=1 Tax=Pseudomonas TaxID=286 RepID=UPI000A1DFC98|nr:MULTISPECIES: FAD-dependent oxidoreductase [unclassified Pseudomonas]MDP9711408.1 glycine/D-amino acid oxidase-like deaminating enzyme [Pseudomonas fluorescens]QZD72135.1 FAD-binding oxidoreductase [Pseudomonas sp. 3-2]